MKRLLATAIFVFGANLAHADFGLNKQQQAQYDAMMNAIDHDDLAAVQRLIQQKVPLDLQQDTRSAPTFLSEAASAGRDRILDALLAAGAKIESCDGDGKTPLLNAVQGRHPSTVALLIKRGADVNAEAADGDTALTLAKEAKQRAIEQLLVQAGAK